MPDNDDWTTADEREHELERIKAQKTSDWAVTVRVVGVWAVIGFVACFWLWVTK